jgi:phosphatidate cytidylyltransferase
MNLTADKESRKPDRREERFNTLGVRVAVAAAGIPLMVGAAWLGGWWLFFLVLALSLLGYREYGRLAGADWREPIWLWGASGVLLILLFFRLPIFPPAAAAAWLMVLMGLMLVTSGDSQPLKSAGAVLLGLFYVPGLLGHLILIREMEPTRGYLSLMIHRSGADKGFLFLVWIMALVWLGDTGAYFSGLLFGKHKLAPDVSPNKTVEGLLGGAAVTALAAVGLAGWWRLGIGTGQALVLALLITALGTLGDLVESKLKRAAGLKDSGSLLPGHGGVLDRFDSLMFAAPAVYWYWKILLRF